MVLLTQGTIMLLLLAMQLTISSTLNPRSISGHGTCPTQEKRDAIITSIEISIEQNLLDLVRLNHCGSGLWYRIAHLDMSNSSQQCPSAWREISNRTSGVRGCRRPQTSSGSCPATFYATSRQYSRVCGRAIGYQIGATNAFGFQAVGQTIDSYYVHGVSVTHSAPRNHIWTLASGLTDGAFNIREGWECPCVDPSIPGNIFPPSFVGNNYYCESGNPTDSIPHLSTLYSTDPLWDGQQCEGECCSNGKSPPWFSVELPNPTTDDIEVRICSAEGSDDDDNDADEGSDVESSDDEITGTSRRDDETTSRSRSDVERSDDETTSNRFRSDNNERSDDDDDGDVAIQLLELYVQ